MNRYIFLSKGTIKLKANIKEDDVMLSKDEICELFKDKSENVTKYIREIFKENSSNKNQLYKNIFKEKCYNLYVVIRVGFMVKNNIGINFRDNYINNIKKQIVKNTDSLIKNKSLNYNKLKNDINNIIEEDEYLGIFNIIKMYSNTLKLLDEYDNDKLSRPQGNKSLRKIDYLECKEIIQNISLNEKSKLFGIERDYGLDSIICNIYQSFKGKDVYPTLEEKACNFLYLIIKNHVFIDGNKRIGAILFIYFLDFYNLFNKNTISPELLVIISLFIAESNPREKQKIIDLLINLLGFNN